MIVITYNEMQAKKIIKDLEYYSKKVKNFPKREILAYDYLAESKENFYERINSLNSIYNNDVDIVVTTIEAVSQEIISTIILKTRIKCLIMQKSFLSVPLFSI